MVEVHTPSEKTNKKKPEVEVHASFDKINKKKPAVEVQASSKKINKKKAIKVHPSSEEINKKMKCYSVKAEPRGDINETTVSNVGLRPCIIASIIIALIALLSCLSKSNLYHRSCYRKLMFNKLPGSRMV